MATISQIEANRLNAQKSTGPRSAEGKASSRFNALKHGADAQALVIPGEDPDDLLNVTREYYEELQPEGVVETEVEGGEKGEGAGTPGRPLTPRVGIRVL